MWGLQACMRGVPVQESPELGILWSTRPEKGLSETPLALRSVTPLKWTPPLLVNVPDVLLDTER